MLKSAVIFTLFFGLALSASTLDLWRALRRSEPRPQPPAPPAPQGKCTKIHPTFTAGFTQTISTSVAGKNFDFINYGIMYSDSPKERKILAKMTAIEPTSGRMTKVLAYELGDFMYLAMPQMNMCVKQPIPGPSTFTAMMEGAKFMGLQTYGGEGDSMVAEKWFVHWADKNMTINIAATMSQKSCTVNNAVGRIKYNGGFMMYQMEYYDVKKSVDDPNIFDLPEYCNNAHEMPSLLK